jgi:hypothetical protein
MPSVSTGEWITIGKGLYTLDAVVCNIRSPDQVASGGDIEVVYLDERDRAINVNVSWRSDEWDFTSTQVDGGYADRYPRLREYVQTLRKGRYRNR